MARLTVSAPQRHHITTRDPDLAHEMLRARYPDHVARVSGSRDRFHFESSATETDHFSVQRMVHTLSLEGAMDRPPALLVTRPSGGRLRVATAEAELSPSVGESLVFDSHLPFRVSWDAIRMAGVTLETAPTMRLISEMSGVPAESVRFPLSKPLSSAHAQQWQADVAHVRHILSVPEIAGSPLIRGEAYRLLVVSLLHVFPNSALAALTDPLASPPRSAEPASVRRAEQYIEANATHDIGTVEIAAAAGVSARALQHAFRRHRDLSPMEHLRLVRLEGAHRQLREGDPTRGDTVADIARAWGFAHLGHFAARYRERFGHAPSETLRH